MPNPEQLTIEDLLEVRQPAEAVISPDGRQVAVVVADGYAPEPGRSPAVRLWLGPAAGPLRQITTGDCVDGLPRWSPTRPELALASDRQSAGRMSLYLVQPGSGQVTPLADVGGTVEEIVWAPDGGSLLLLAADVGLDTAGSLNAVTIAEARQAAPDPVVISGPAGLRRLWQVDRPTGAFRPVDLGGRNVWDFGWTGSGALAAIVSADPSESGWYTASLEVFDLADPARPLATYRPGRQLGVPRLSPDGRQLAFIEGVCSDRGIIAGELMITAVGAGDLPVRRLGLDNVTHLDWRDAGTLVCTTMTGLGSTVEVADVAGGDGTRAWHGDVTLGYRHHVRTSMDATGRRLVTVAEGANAPPEAYHLSLTGEEAGRWTPLTALNAGLIPQSRPVWEPLHWKSADGQEVEGIVVLPPGRPAEGLPLVVLLHGGPTSAWSYQWSNFGLPALWATAGYAVLMPNPRGSAGYGQAFAEANVHDMGGGELRDVLAGVDTLVARGVADESRLGVTGASHGGYLTNWAITQTSRFAAAIPIAASCNRLSKYNTGNIGYLEELFYDADPYDQAGLVLARSPILHVRNVVTPTLIVHGELDRCVPVSQAHEMYGGISRLGTVPVELVVYPREGHGISERGHRIDFWHRAKSWFDHYVAGTVSVRGDDPPDRGKPRVPGSRS
jgi:dipeptidyl aminopeptidase/acylaminoacyl peptidase